MQISLLEVTALLGQCWWPFIRVTGFFLIAPIFGDKTIPTKTRVYLALVISCIVTPLNTQASIPFNPFQAESALLTVNELFIGFCLGLVFNILFSVFSQAGQIISMQMGLAMAVMNDPNNGVSASIMSRIFMICATLAFLSMDGHILMVYILKESLNTWPLHTPIYTLDLSAFLKIFSWFFTQSVLLAIPSVAIMLTSNITFGLLSKLAPSLNIFSLGFPFTILMGLLAFFLTLFNIGESLAQLSQDLNLFFDEIFEG